MDTSINQRLGYQSNKSCLPITSNISLQVYKIHHGRSGITVGFQWIWNCYAGFDIYFIHFCYNTIIRMLPSQSDFGAKTVH